MSAASTPFITFEDVTYAYPGAGEHAPPALRECSLTIARGEFVAILGHNGGGKSTLARHCNALLVPSAGRVLVDGFDTRDPNTHPAIRDRVGMIFQQPDNQIIATVVGDDVAWALAVRGMPAPVIHERVDWALAATGIAALRDLPPHRLSGGQRQRLAIAGVLALRPACVIADEATAQLDPRARAAIVALLHRLRREHGLTILHVTHLVEEAVTADRVVVLDRGAVALEGTPAEVFADLMPLRALKLAIPEPLALAERLRAAGVPLSSHALTAEEIARELAP